MRVRNRILVLCIILCTAVITLPGIILIHSSNESLQEYEFNSLRRDMLQAKNTFTNMYYSEQHLAYIESFDSPDLPKKDTDPLVKKVAQELFSGFKSTNLFVDLFSWNKELLYSNHVFFSDERKEILDYKEGTWSLSVKKIEEKRFTVITDSIEIADSKLIISLSRDISHVDDSLRTQYLVFFIILAGAIALLSIIIPLVTAQITKPIEELVETAEEISNGHYNRRVIPRGKDEIGRLGLEFNRMTEAIEHTISLLNEQAEQKQRFIDNLTHELMNPLTSIIGYADFLRSNKYNKKIFDKSLGYIYTEGKRIGELAERLFDLMLFKNKKAALKKEKVMPLFQEIRENLQFKLRRKEITAVLEGKDFSIGMDRTLMKAALVNLVDNAIKASPFGANIYFGAEKNRMEAVLFVRDEGKGIKQSELKKILEPFYQVEKGKTGPATGAGLGLAITVEIVNLHGAKLEYDSTEGKGTTARIIFQKSI
ncbi:MAG: HAMP domain-containing histidine kinase [Spirochaetales bacterium]|nr:HAMP domain-containing histidine kinase [Spirochaetales bacterium]